MNGRRDEFDSTSSPEQTALSDAARQRGRYATYTRRRLQQFSRRLERLIYQQKTPVSRIEISDRVDRIPQAEGIKLPLHDAGIGEQLGPLWATYWVRITATIPQSWRGARVDLYWDSQSEALLWLNGRAEQGLNPDRYTATLIPSAHGGETLTFWLEVACNGMFGAPRRGQQEYRINACELRRFDPDAYAFHADFEFLRELEADREPAQTSRSYGGANAKIVRPALDNTWSGKLLHELNKVCNVANLDDKNTWPAARAILQPLLASKNAATTHELSAIGHAHLDTAWLWPLDETRRKAQRTFATAIRLMDAYPEFKFAVSQAYQYAIIEKTDPDLFARIHEKVKTGQWIPVGGSWIEPDCNLPTGESMCRQYLYGQRYFERQFGRRSTVFWNPDVFGYDGQLPQLMREAGMQRFLTQKLSWNKFTSPPHHSFTWRGIDGTEVLTHFPPVDTYNAMASAEELRYHAANYKDSDRSAHAYYLFGYGDGGGGANAKMLENLRRATDLQGVPRSKIRTPDEFFDLLAADTDNFGVIEGELYFEYHRGVYTSQSETKRLNRLCETRLQALEYLATVCRLSGKDAPSPAEIEELWRVVLTNQFHDILPGSSIGEVYTQTEEELTDIAEKTQALCDTLLARLSTGTGATPVNTLGVPRTEVTTTPSGALAYVTAEPFSIGRTADTADKVTVEEGDTITLRNAALTATLARDGNLISLIHNATQREALAGPANRILLFDDQPLDYDAWDIDPFALETARDATPAHSCTIVTRDPLRAELRFERKLGRDSTLTQIIRLDAGANNLVFDSTIDWHERKTLVKAMFPLDIRAGHATYETMFGAAERPTHANTDGDLAKYEVPGQRWADLSEPGFGLSLLSDVKHGYSCLGNKLALSLIRGPMMPDPNADIGTHRFRYALYPHAGDWRSANTVTHAAAFTRPLLWAKGTSDAILARPLVTASAPNVIVDTIKQAEDGAGWIVRLYESTGARTNATLT
ncbi:MAG TPA: glycoside hydrolase family 38 C-terminal domain-containing protein, partial [Rhizomicrobium sp.]|nr:glycoside hydrolase family 38 C-terminal domain-containing protein [Rhizomicrobium sp.]